MKAASVGKAKKYKPKKQPLKKRLVRYWPLYVMLIPCIIYYALICYVPMAGSVLAFKDYSFWLPKKFVRSIKNVTKFKRIFYPSDFRVNLKKDNSVYNVSMHYAISCITDPQNHMINEIENDRAYREYAGF